MRHHFCSDHAYQRSRDFLFLKAVTKAHATINFTDISIRTKRKTTRFVEASQKGQGARNFLTFKSRHGKYRTHVQILRSYLSVLRFSTLLPYSRDLSFRSERRYIGTSSVDQRYLRSKRKRRDSCNKNKFLLPLRFLFLAINMRFRKKIYFYCDEIYIFIHWHVYRNYSFFVIGKFYVK